MRLPTLAALFVASACAAPPPPSKAVAPSKHTPGEVASSTEVESEKAASVSGPEPESEPPADKVLAVAGSPKGPLGLPNFDPNDDDAGVGSGSLPPRSRYTPIEGGLFGFDEATPSTPEKRRAFARFIETRHHAEIEGDRFTAKVTGTNADTLRITTSRLLIPTLYAKEEELAEFQEIAEDARTLGFRKVSWTSEHKRHRSSFSGPAAVDETPEGKRRAFAVQIRREHEAQERALGDWFTTEVTGQAADALLIVTRARRDTPTEDVSTEEAAEFVSIVARAKALGFRNIVWNSPEGKRTAE